jgi:hypothetical protein
VSESVRSTVLRLRKLRRPLVDHGQQKQTRKTAAKIAEIKAAILEILDAHHPQTVRQVYYQLVVRNLIAKTEKEYKGTVIRLLTKMRMDDEVEFGWIVDESRRRQQYRTHSSLVAAVQATARFYRRNALNECSDYIEIFVGKQALVGFVHEAAGEYDVPVIPGGNSLSQLWETAICIRNAWLDDKRSYIYQFDDYDASALVIAQSIERRLIELCRKLDCPPPIFERIALTPEQIEEFDLPSRPSKTFEQGNMHAKNFEGESTELDALPPEELKRLVTEVIERHISPEQLEVLRETEASEREVLKAWVERIEDEDDDDDEQDEEEESE